MSYDNIAVGNRNNALHAYLREMRETGIGSADLKRAAVAFCNSHMDTPLPRNEIEEVVRSVS